MLHPSNASYISNPYEMFRHLRLEKPVYFAEELGLWVISRYEDAQKVLKDASIFSNQLSVVPIAPVCEHAQKILSENPMCPVIATSDPPDHTRFRKAISQVFPNTPQQAKKYEPMIQKYVNDLLPKDYDANQIDMVKHFSWELPVNVILNILGIPEKDFGHIKKWADGLVNMIWGTPDEQTQVKLSKGMGEFIQYCHAQVAKRVKQPEDDFISDLIRYRNGDDQVLTLEEIAITAVNFLTAGHETTANLIANAVYQLLKNEQWHRISEQPELIPQAIEEVLRLDSPIVGWLRYTLKDVSISDVLIPAHSRVLVLLGSANHDEALFDNPEEFILMRENKEKHISFSVGRHFCIGAALARLEAEIALRHLSQYFPNMKLEPGFTPTYIPNMAFRAMETLPVRLR
jgi:cytochrome P450